MRRIAISMPWSKSVFVIASELVKAHQHLGILIGHRTAERMPRQRGNDLLRAARLS